MGNASNFNASKEITLDDLNLNKDYFSSESFAKVIMKECERRREINIPLKISDISLILNNDVASSNKKSTLIIIDKKVDPESKLHEAVSLGTKVVNYNSDEDSLSSLVELVQNAHKENGDQFSIVGFANHGGEVWKIASDLYLPLNPDNSKETVQNGRDLFDALVSVTKKSGRIDLLGCLLLKFDQNLVKSLESFYAINFTASDDETGNLQAGGDWIVESDTIDISADYFDREKLQNYKEVMAIPVMVVALGLVAGFGLVAALDDGFI